jgi:hypothetical protein
VLTAGELLAADRAVAVEAQECVSSCPRDPDVIVALQVSAARHLPNDSGDDLLAEVPGVVREIALAAVDITPVAMHRHEGVGGRVSEANVEGGIQSEAELHERRQDLRGIRARRP